MITCGVLQIQSLLNYELVITPQCLHSITQTNVEPVYGEHNDNYVSQIVFAIHLAIVAAVDIADYVIG